MRLCSTLACALFAAACGTSDPGASPSSTACPASSSNEKGVGRPCTTSADCAGGPARLCPVADVVGDLDFCTLACDLLAPNQCGTGAECVPQGYQSAKCVPGSCAVALAEPARYPTARIPCDTLGPVNDLGVGRPCTEHADCAGQAMDSCPMAINAVLPNWCSSLCDTDADCGDHAFCWVRPSIDGGLVGSCAPRKCQTFTDVTIPCAGGAVNALGIGRPCAVADDCRGLPASECAVEQGGWCTLPCDDDDACGKGAYCWGRSNDAGERERLCAPIACQTGEPH